MGDRARPLRIDAHHHLWEQGRAFRATGDGWALGATRYAWAEAGLEALDGTFTSDQLVVNLDHHDLDGSILVNVLNNQDESRWLLEVAASEPRILGVVGWVDLAAPAELVGADLAELRGRGPLVGVRHLAQFEPDPAWLTRPAVVAGLGVLSRDGLVVDLLVTERELPTLPKLAEALPDVTFVLDHAAKPPIRSGRLNAWSKGLRDAAENPRLVCKMSGLVTEAAIASWRPDDLLPAMSIALEAFGPERLMFGSDWPVCTLAAGYDRVVEATERNLEKLLGSDYARFEPSIFGGLAESVYGLSHQAS